MDTVPAIILIYVFFATAGLKGLPVRVCAVIVVSALRQLGCTYSVVLKKITSIRHMTAA